MKKVIILAAFLPMFLVSCGGNSSDDGNKDGVEDTLNVDFADMSEISLQENGLDLKLMLPEMSSSTGASMKPQITHDDGDYLWTLAIGPRFQMVIEDFADKKNKVGEEKARLEKLSNIFQVEYLLDEPKLMMYRRTLHEGQGGQTSYHCYGEIEINGFTYVLRSEQEGSLKPIIEDMVKTIRSAKAITNA